MPFPYKTVLVTGATSGIGEALTERMVAAGVFVIAVGRRRGRLDALVAKHGVAKVAAEEYDVSKVEGMDAWVKKITSSYPNLDSIVLNAGLQRTVNFTKPSSIDLSAITTEVHTNYLSPVHMLSLFLPHLLSLASSHRPTSIVLVSSGLALVPIPRCVNYCATKAALHSLAWTLRTQLGGVENLRVIEIIPPAVQTELHSQQADLAAAGQARIGMPLDEYADDTWAALVGDEVQDEIMASAARARFGHIESDKRKGYEAMLKMMQEMGISA